MEEYGIMEYLELTVTRCGRWTGNREFIWSGLNLSFFLYHRKASFLALVNEHNPDIMCGSESHLDQSFYTSEIFPDAYNVFRKDRTLGGGVFLCIKKQLQVLEEPSLDTEAELIWIKLTPPNQRPIHICAFYRPPTSDLYPIEQLHLSLSNLLNQSKMPSSHAHLCM